MSAVFVAGPLAWPPLLDRVSGAPVAAGATPAHLVDAGLGAAQDVCFPPLLPGPGARAEGRLVPISDPAQYDRLCFFAGALGRVPVPRHVETAQGRRAAVAFMTPDAPEAPPGEHWDAARWQARWGAVALAATDEIMGYFGRLPPEELGWRMPMILSRAASRVQAARTAPARLRSAFPAADVAECARRDRHAGYFLTREYELRQPALTKTSDSPPVRREVFVATDAALVLPYDPARDRVLLVEQFRMGPYGRGDPLPFVLEPVAGRMDAGESPEEAARRECLEEAGLRLGRLEHMTSHYCSPGTSTEFYHCFLGLADLPDRGQGRGGLATEHEDIRTHVLSFDRAMALVESGEANAGPLVLMLLWLGRARARLRAAA